ncbi:uncharacterized protein N7518_007896 [Penicillium psychrosexuale]|uniref:uncharacterized protein n=1 Tax=Penicillium psychrosexuale TaxID=1002107 RepID=UPI002545B5FC|nr:uncharacterized protein N7518_007896 [Penicillium psychrosexuale]KAJ5790885.1 hypothetical protein N7518_007896 [Penicillium psychrosexuale]
MPSYKNNPPDEEYLDSIKKHTDKETNNPEAAQTPPKKATNIIGATDAIKTVTEIVREAGEASANRRSSMQKGKGSENDKKKQA